MEGGLLVALGFAVAIIVLAVVLTRAFRPRKGFRGDLNASGKDARSTASWAAIREARRHEDDDI